jgi:probable F420-dependent oxidoreductase
VKIGIFALLTATSPPVATLAREIEARGFDSLWLPEHSHIPTTSIYPDGRPVTREYGRTLDPFAALAVAAAATTKLLVATGVCLLTQRDTIHTAKTVATLDQLSHGRFLFGVGGGWNRPELENHGADFPSRFRKLTEQIEALKIVWTRDEPEIHGEFVDFGPMWCWPKPVQKPGPPIYVGGESEHTLRRIVAHADGWLPRARDAAAVIAGIERLRHLAEAAGRDPNSIPISAIGVAPRAEALAPFRAAGAERVVLGVPTTSADVTLAKLDEYEALLRA